MYIARWRMTAQEGHREAVLLLLRKWEADVGQRIGWRSGAIRLTVGRIGVAQTRVEMDVRVDSLADLESAWSDMAKTPYHPQYLKELAGHLVSGETVWQVLEEVTLG